MEIEIFTAALRWLSGAYVTRAFSLVHNPCFENIEWVIVALVAAISCDLVGSIARVILGFAVMRGLKVWLPRHIAQCYCEWAERR